MGFFCFGFDKTESSRPGIELKLRVVDNRAGVQISPVTIRGSNSGTLAFVPDAARYTLPFSRPCRLQEVTDVLDPKEILGTKGALVVYWQTNYGIDVSNCALFARALFGSNSFTYPSSCLLSTALTVDDKHRQGVTQEREGKLQTRLLDGLRGLHLFASLKED
jgi:hypothetical protein